ncbi:uncharacterized protein JCM10292_000038 [Rhodotorula paludigena]|uniref:uncharacterized protein n=1 Tax=Rhodotorula paludigena TaxID=86838 RepID=UPI0031717203
MSSRGPTVSPSGTPGSLRYNPSSVGTAPPTASQRQRRRLLILLGAVAGVVALVLVVVLPSTLLTRDDGGSDAESQSVVTTVIDGVTRTITNAEVVTRSRLSTLENGEITTLTSVVNLPVITVSPSAIATVQPEIVTTTLSGGAVIVVEEATSLRTQVATVTFTASNGVVGVETLTLTSFELVTVIECPGFDDEHQFQLVQCDDNVGDFDNEQHFHQQQLDHSKPIEHDCSAFFDYHEQLYEQSEHELEQHGLVDDTVDLEQQRLQQQQQLVVRFVVNKRHHYLAANIVFVKLRQYLGFELQRELELDFGGRLRVDERDEQLFQLELLIFEDVDHRIPDAAAADDDHYSARWPVLDDDEIQLVGRDLHHWLAPARLRARLDLDDDHDLADDGLLGVTDRDDYVGWHGRALHHPGAVPAWMYGRDDEYEKLDEQYSDCDDDHKPDHDLCPDHVYHEHDRRADINHHGRAVHHPGAVPARMHRRGDEYKSLNEQQSGYHNHHDDDLSQWRHNHVHHRRADVNHHGRAVYHLWTVPAWMYRRAHQYE